VSYFEVLFVTWACLGDFALMGKAVRPVPEPLRPLAAAVKLGSGAPLCRIEPQKEAIPARPAALARVKALGPGAAPRLRWCRGFRCWERAVEWRPSLYVDGEVVK
jgi:hypothetical protein